MNRLMIMAAVTWCVAFTSLSAAPLRFDPPDHHYGPPPLGKYTIAWRHTGAHGSPTTLIRQIGLTPPGQRPADSKGTVKIHTPSVALPNSRI